MDEKRSNTAAATRLAATGAGPLMQSAPGSPTAETQAPSMSSSELLACACLSLMIRVAALALVACSFARAAWRARHEPWDLAFVLFACAALAALLLCLRLAERLTPTSPAGEGRRLQAAVWALSSALSCAFAYRVSLVMPAALVLVIWSMASFVVVVGFYMLVLHNELQFHGLDNVGCDAVGDAKPFIKKVIKPSDELV